MKAIENHLKDRHFLAFFIAATKFGIKDDPHYAMVMLGIIENYYSKEEIKEWIQHGKIREFRR